MKIGPLLRTIADAAILLTCFYKILISNVSDETGLFQWLLNYKDELTITMNFLSLLDSLERIIIENLNGTIFEQSTSGTDSEVRNDSYNITDYTSPKDLTSSTSKMQARQIAQELIQQALTSGLKLTTTDLSHRPLSGGNTAEFVGEIKLTAPFVFKIDSVAHKLALEGLAIQKIKGDERLSKRFRDAWPIIYALRTETPYAYLMEFFRKEDGWSSLENILYPQDTKVDLNEPYVVRLMNAVLDIFFEGYSSSLNKRHIPSIQEDYIGRIKERLIQAAAKDDRFSSKSLVVNGLSLKPWKEYLDIIDSRFSDIVRISPTFTTIVHGDPNPGNLLLKVSVSTVNLKLIDPKEWVTGDYLFDIAKITHFIEATGPIELLGNTNSFLFNPGEDVNEMNYSLQRPVWTNSIVEVCKSRVTEFAKIHNDKNWAIRYELGMASNLLGLPANRLEKGEDTFALMLYGEGMIWLDRFCRSLETIGNR